MVAPNVLNWGYLSAAVLEFHRVRQSAALTVQTFGGGEQPKAEEKRWETVMSKMLDLSTERITARGPHLATKKDLSSRSASREHIKHAAAQTTDKFTHNRCVVFTLQTLRSRNFVHECRHVKFAMEADLCCKIGAVISEFETKTVLSPFPVEHSTNLRCPFELDAESPAERLVLWLLTTPYVCGPPRPARRERENHNSTRGNNKVGTKEETTVRDFAVELRRGRWAAPRAM
ncbi:hypothetical protein Bbelb_384320 [Branchiostoma belcheri]|nr:hypothetical protein Bbelb_384320 [Branchiostoma belcheri]